jgi:hypothetical protein
MPDTFLPILKRIDVDEWIENPQKFATIFYKKFNCLHKTA